MLQYQFIANLSGLLEAVRLVDLVVSREIKTPLTSPVTFHVKSF